MGKEEIKQAYNRRVKSTKTLFTANVRRNNANYQKM